METIETTLQKLTWGLLANDFVGFHTKEYCDNYLEALEEWFPVNIDVNGDCYEITSTDRVTTVGAIPIGVDVDRILPEVAEDKILEHRVDGKDLYHMIQEDRNQGKLIFGGLERRDYTKGLIERCSIFAHILKRLRAEDKDARLYQTTSPSRFENPSYRYLSRALDREIERTNKGLGGEPIVHINEGIPAPQNYRFLKQVEVMLVTPLEDGMNLVAFEYILSQKHLPPERRGLLVLGTSGASRILREKGFGPEQGLVTVNPMRPSRSGEQVFAAIRAGCRVSEELIAYIEKERRVKDWARKNVGGILECRKRP
jgi:trehalose 6-phosphate synthase